MVWEPPPPVRVKNGGAPHTAKNTAKKPAEPPPVAHAIADSLAAVVKKYGRERLELEFRLGHRTGSGASFVPGVPEAEWQRLKAALDGCEAFGAAHHTDARELIDRGSKYVMPTAGAGHWMHKQRMKDIDVDVSGCPWTCRASMSLEVVDPPSASPEGACKFERHKRRWSYRYRCWSVDLTEVMSNLPHQMDNDGKSFEVEIELADTSELFARPMVDIAAWGLVLAKDMCGLMMAS
jgi:hypothetical protein